MRKLLTSWLLFVSLLVVPTLSDAQTQHSPRAVAHGLSIEAWRPDASIVVTRSRQGVVVDITSPFGTGRGVIRRLGEKWPAQIRIRLNLRGLELFRAVNDTIDLRWSVSHKPDHRTRLSLRTGTDTKILKTDSPYWTTVGVAGDNKENAPEYFEVSLPANLFSGNPRELKLQWVDFFRG